MSVGSRNESSARGRALLPATPGRSARGRLAVAVALAALWGLAWASPARAHRASITHATAEVLPTQRGVTYRLQMSPPDAAELLGLAPDTDPDAAAVEQRQARLFARLFEHIEVRDGDTTCPAVPGRAAITEDRGGRFLTATWEARCGAPMTQLVIEYTLFFDIDPLHRSFLHVSYRDRRAFEELGPGRNRLVWELGEPPPQGAAGFLLSGAEHIFTGFDHIAFLLALLLAVVVWRPGGVNWQRRPLGSALRDTAILVTTFTVAHSLTLITASLGWVELDGRLVECVIAASIVYVAIENLIRPTTGYRHIVTFAFGLVHGLGFASMLAVLLPPQDVLVPLVLFNLGVELGQLAIVCAAMPLLHLLARTGGARAYRRWVLSIGSFALALVGALWLIERALEIVILGF